MWSPEVIGERYNPQIIFSRREISRNRIKALNDLSTHRIYRDFKAKPEAPVQSLLKFTLVFLSMWVTLIYLSIVLS